MTTRTITNQGPKFSDDLKAERRRYERVKENLETLFNELSPLEQAIHEATGYSEFNLPPPGVHETRIPDEGDVDVQFLVKTHMRTKKPAYKKIYETMKQYLSGILFLLSQGKTITGIRKENGVPYIRVEAVKEAYDIIVGGELDATIRHDVNILVRGPLAEEGTLSKLVIEERDRGALTQENFILYLRGIRIMDDYNKFIKKYEAKLKKQMPPKRKDKTVQVTSTRAYRTKKVEGVRPDYTSAVRMIVRVPVKTHAKLPPGELNQLVDPGTSFRKKVKMFPHYDMVEKSVRGKKVAFISIPSIYKRLTDLIGEKPTQYETFQITPKEVIR